jgi:hypothetical protein
LSSVTGLAVVAADAAGDVIPCFADSGELTHEDRTAMQTNEITILFIKSLLTHMQMQK